MDDKSSGTLMGGIYIIKNLSWLLCSEWFSHEQANEYWSRSVDEVLHFSRSDQVSLECHNVGGYTEFHGTDR